MAWAGCACILLRKGEARFGGVSGFQRLILARCFLFENGCRWVGVGAPGHRVRSGRMRQLAGGKEILRVTMSAALLLTACKPAPADLVMTNSIPVADACGAADLQTLVGKSQTVLRSQRFGPSVRIIKPGIAVTMDYRTDRMNIEINTGGKIARVYCG